MEIGEVSVTDEAVVLSVENGNAVSVPVLNVIDYSQAGLSVSIEEIEHLDARLRENSLSNLIILRSIIPYVRFRFFLQLTICESSSWMSCENVTTLLTTSMTAHSHIFNKGMNVMLRGTRSRLEVM